jgi:predicted nucleic acid-binding protein
MSGVDTNVLLYRKDPRDPRKQSIADGLIRSVQDGVLLWQVACEFVAASRKLVRFGYSQTEAWDDIEDLLLIWSCSLPSLDTFRRAHSLLGRFSLSFWDALIVAACLEAGATRLYSEDFSAYPRRDTLEIVNPFAP